MTSKRIPRGKTLLTSLSVDEILGKALSKPSRKRSPTNYSGRLAEPLPLIPPLSPAVAALMPPNSRTKYERLAQQQILEVVQRLALLLDHYEIDRKNEDRWLLLAFALARHHVPGLQLEAKKRQRGVAKTWTTGDEMRLYCAVRFLVESGKSERAACEILEQKAAQDDPWAGNRSATIRRRFKQLQQGDLAFLDKMPASQLQRFLKFLVR